ncbi:MAG: class III signal peptide-containing protein [Candidatus Altiarchaeota archaeon]|nr:class III signal peptide-containing protein [Candidatus Altiarchaeota archaeon]
MYTSKKGQTSLEYLLIIVVALVVVIGIFIWVNSAQEEATRQANEGMERFWNVLGGGNNNIPTEPACGGICDSEEAECPPGYEPGSGRCNPGDQCCVVSGTVDPDSCAAYGGICVNSNDCYGYPSNRIATQDSACRPVSQGGAGEGYNVDDVYCCKLVDCSTLGPGASCWYDVTCWNDPLLQELPEGHPACYLQFHTWEQICCGLVG